MPSGQGLLSAYLEIIVGRKYMRLKNMEEFLDLNIFIGCTYVAWKRPIDVSRNVTIAPQPCVRATEADN
jgi:hypothetical protein